MSDTSKEGSPANDAAVAVAPTSAAATAAASKDPLAASIAHLLTPGRDLGETIRAVAAQQQQLNAELEELNRRLAAAAQQSGTSHQPQIDAYAARLRASRTRIEAVVVTLFNTKTRLQAVHERIAAQTAALNRESDGVKSDLLAQKAKAQQDAADAAAAAVRAEEEAIAKKKADEEAAAKKVEEDAAAAAAAKKKADEEAAAAAKKKADEEAAAAAAKKKADEEAAKKAEADRKAKEDADRRAKEEEETRRRNAAIQQQQSSTATTGSSGGAAASGGSETREPAADYRSMDSTADQDHSRTPRSQQKEKEAQKKDDGGCPCAMM